MNEYTQAAPATSSPSGASETPKPNVLRIVLFSILAVMIVALIYEYGFVRPSYKAAETAIDDLIETRGVADTGPITPQVVQARFGKAPAGGTQDKGEYFLEHYRWVRGLPWQTYNIYVVYDHSEPPLLFNSTRPGPPGPNEVPSKVVPLAPDALSSEGGAEPGAPGDESAPRREQDNRGPDGDAAQDGRPAAEEAAPDSAPSEAPTSSDSEAKVPAASPEALPPGEPAADSDAKASDSTEPKSENEQEP
jgi:hypothetical protein